MILGKTCCFIFNAIGLYVCVLDCFIYVGNGEHTKWLSILGCLQIFRSSDVCAHWLTVSVEFTCVWIYTTTCAGNSMDQIKDQNVNLQDVNAFWIYWGGCFFVNVSNEERDIFLCRNREADLHFDANYQYFVLESLWKTFTNRWR